MRNILITGGKGQLASSLKSLSGSFKGYTLIYKDRDELDITQLEDLRLFFKSNSITHCVNCAAYTAVDKAEEDEYTAQKINVEGTRNLAIACEENSAVLIHISTDFVFDGTKSTPYKEDDSTNPLGVYGKTKRDGEVIAMDHASRVIILRTSWLYSEFGNNFLKSMLRLGEERDLLNVVFDQVGTPTYARDLAEVIQKIIVENIQSYGIYHYSNEGVASWYDFAKSIFDEAGLDCKVLPINSDQYPTAARRPAYSVMDKKKIKENLAIEIPYWKDSMKKCIKEVITKI